MGAKKPPTSEDEEMEELKRLEALLDELSKDPEIAKVIRREAIEATPQAIRTLHNLWKNTKDPEIRAKSLRGLRQAFERFTSDLEGGRKEEIYRQISQEFPRLLKELLPEKIQ